MKGSTRKGGGGLRMLAGIAALGLSLALTSPAHAAPQYALDCTSCHNMPPKDSGTAKKNPMDGSVPGNHTQHAGSSKDSCVVCHGSQVTGYATGHRNKSIELSDALQYGRKVNGFLNQTSVPPNPLSSCASAACHSDGTGVTRSTSTFRATPAWGSAPLAKDQQSSCVTCHDVAPNSGNHPSLSGAGKKHGDYFGTGTGACVKCHSDHFAEAAPFAHATSAGKRTVEVKFASGGGFDGANCNNVYCHSNGKGAFQSPTWGGSLDCSGCHGTASTDTLSGKHPKHLNNAGFLGTNYGCIECHAATVSSDSTIADTTKHVNGSVDLAGPRVGTPVSGTCATAYCHSDGKGNFKSVTWSQSQSLDCKGCHGSDPSPDFTSLAGEPNYANAGPDQTLANSHKNHVKATGDCANCHYATTTNGTSIAAGGQHTDGSIELAPGPGRSFTISNKTCSNVSCHSGNGIITNVQPAKWGASLGCTGCHGDASSLASYAHAKHVNLSTGKGYACDTCHAATVSGSSTIIDSTLHGNGVRDVNSFFNASNTTCSNVSCHGSATPNWTDSTTGACGSCHAALSTTANGLIASNAHSAHFGAAYGPKLDGTSSNSCAVCHVYTTDLAASHVNGTVNLNAGFSKNGTCSTCHYQTTDWTAGRISCDNCHLKSSANNNTLSVINSVTAPDKSLAGTLGHGRSGIDQSCTACHDNTSAHIGVAGGTSRLQSGLTGAANAECNYCHQDSNKVTPEHLNMQVHIATATSSNASSCAACHDPHGTGNANMVRTTLAGTSGVAFSGSDFVNDSGTGVCQSCHTQTAYYKQGVQETNHPATGCLDCHKHNSASGTAFEPNRACDSCHGYPPVPRNPAVAFGVHGQYSSARFEDYSGGGGAHVAMAHLDPSVTPDMKFTPCLMCHNGADATHTKALPLKSHIENVKVIVDPQYRFSADVSFMGYTNAKLVSGANKSGSCFNVSCHFKPSPQWSIEK